MRSMKNTFISEYSKKNYNIPLRVSQHYTCSKYKLFELANEVIIEWLFGMFATSYTAELLLKLLSGGTITVIRISKLILR